MLRPVHIGLVFDYSVGYCRGVLRGIKKYAEARPHWVLVPIVADARAIRTLAKARPDGLITYVYRQPIIELLSGMRKPWVSVCGVLPDFGVPRVGTDDELMGGRAATHLLDRGIRHFGFIGHTRNAASTRRETSFRRAIERAGFTVDCYEEHGERRFDSRANHWAPGRHFHRWVCSLPKPVGVSSFYDMWGLQLSEVCREEGIRVPEDVAIVGMGNDDLLCELARPSLSSVVVPTGQIGYDAAALLERLMSGSKPPDRPVLLPPIGVATRQSSDILAIDDPEVAEVIRLIRQRSHLPIGVKDILREVSISRRTLERRFQTFLNRSISREIRRVQMERAKGLLSDTGLPMPAVAGRSGFSNGRYFSVVFRQETGLTPTEYRRRFLGQPHVSGD
jgi:LacI family transcriptional regulator